MTTRRIRTRQIDALGRMPGSRSMSSAGAVNPCVASDDSGAFRLPDARDSHRTSGVLLSGSDRGAAAHRLTAEATRSCFCCKGGLDRCDACKGRGYSEDRDTCDRCLGTGYRSCDFCGGSGLVIEDGLAPDLIVAVAIERIRDAARQLKVILDRPVLAVSVDDPGRSLEEGGRALLQVNRLVAMLEEGLHLLRAENRKVAGGRRDLLRVVRFCLERVLDCQRRMREIIKGMAIAAERLAELSGPRMEDREVAAKRAAFFAGLLKRSGLLTGTGFDRVLLDKAGERLRQSEPTASEGGRR